MDITRSTDFMFHLEIQELNVSERTRLLSKLLELYNITITDEDFDLFSEQLYGLPEQVMYCVDFIKSCGLLEAKKTIYKLTEYNSEKASLLLQRYEDKEECLDFIRLLAQFEIISTDFLFSITDEAKYFPILEDLVTENICEYMGVEGEMIRLNDSIRDYIKRNRLDIKYEFKNKIKLHVSEFLQDEDPIGRDSSDYIFSIKEALANGDLVDESKLIPSHFLRCMKDLYQKRENLDRIIALAKRVLQKEAFMEQNIIEDIRYYLCLALARKKDKRVLEEVQKIQGDEHNFILGYYYRLIGRHRDAIERLTTILTAPYVGTRATRELVQVYIQTENYNKALDFARKNYMENKGNQFHIQAYFQCLIHSDQYKENKDILQTLITELNTIGSEQSKQMALIAEALYLAKIDNNQQAALDKINDAIMQYHDIPYPILAKFDIALRFRDIKEMEDSCNKLEALSKRISISERTYIKQKAYLEAVKGNDLKALEMLKPEIDRYPDTSKEKIIDMIRTLARKNGDVHSHQKSIEFDS